MDEIVIKTGTSDDFSGGGESWLVPLIAVRPCQKKAGSHLMTRQTLRNDQRCPTNLSGQPLVTARSKLR